MVADYDTQLVTDLSAIGAPRWNALVQHACGELHPALRFEFLHALHTTGCAAAATGWEPCFLTLWQGGDLRAALPLYRKHHSYGEYVFDWSWANAAERAGLNYYPKLLSAVPFTPVSAPKLLAMNSAARAALADALLALMRDSAAPSLHLLFTDAEETALLQARDFQLRHGVQFHWRNAAYQNFEEFLLQLSSSKRRKVRAERRKVAEASVQVQALVGAEIKPADWAFFTACYERTYLEHRASPYLNQACFEQWGRSMGEQMVLFIAQRNGEALAASLCLFSASTLYGRYWGALTHVDCLHFEACYYAPIEFCITRGLQFFEGGAQGEHKLARGFEPQETHSLHRLADPRLSQAVQRFLSYEALGMSGYLNELSEHSAFSQAHKNQNL